MIKERAKINQGEINSIFKSEEYNETAKFWQKTPQQIEFTANRLKKKPIMSVKGKISEIRD